MDKQWLIDGKTAMDRLDDMMNEIIPFIKYEMGSMNKGTVNGIFKANELLSKMCIEEKIEAIPIDWIEDYITMLVIGSHSNHEPELEEENKKKAQAIRQMVEDWGCPEQYDKCIEKLREIQHRQAKELLERVKTDKTVGCVIDDYAIGQGIDYRETEEWKNLVETIREFETKKLEERISNTEKTLKELKEDLARYLTLPTGYQ